MSAQILAMPRVPRTAFAPAPTPARLPGAIRRAFRAGLRAAAQVDQIEDLWRLEDAAFRRGWMLGLQLRSQPIVTWGPRLPRLRRLLTALARTLI